VKAVGHHNGWVIIATFILALMLTFFPLPTWLAMLRPEWVVLVLIYWCLALPERVGVGVGWLAGLTLDVARGALLGQYAVGLALVAFLVMQLHKRIRLFPVWQQAISVMLLVMLTHLLAVWVSGITGHPGRGLLGWLPSFTSLLVWPLVLIALRGVRRYYRVS